MIKAICRLFMALVMLGGMAVAQPQGSPRREITFSEPSPLGRALGDVRGVRDVLTILANEPQIEIRLLGGTADDVLAYRYAPPFLGLLLGEGLGFEIEEVRTDKGIKHKEDYGSISELISSEGTAVIRRSSVIDPITALIRVINYTSSDLLDVKRPLRAEHLEAQPARGWSLACLWWVMLIALALLILPLQAACERCVPQLINGGMARSFVLSLFLISYLAWVFQAIGSFPATAVGLWTFLLLLAYLSWRERDRFFGDGRGKRFFYTSILFLLILGLFVILRSLHPEIHWGEKPMDFAFLNYFTRVEQLPPHDPWAAGNLMHYYYFGYYAFGQLLKITGISPGVGYNLGVATLGAWMVLAAYGGLRIFGLSRLAALSGAIAISCLSNVEWFWLLLVDGKKIDFDTFWATTRLLSSPAITEYPFWGQLFADLHPHVMGEPILMIGLSTVLWFGMIRSAREIGLGEGLFISGIIGTLLALLYLINSWDMLSLIYGAVAVSVCGGLGGAEFLTWRDQRKRVVRCLLVVVGGVGAMFLLILPHLLSSRGGPRPWAGFVTGAEFNRVGPVLRHLGLWLVPIGAALLTTISFEKVRRCRTKKSLIALCFGLFPLALGVLGVWYGVLGTPWWLYSTLGLAIGCAVLTLLITVEPVVQVAAAAVF